MSSVFRRASDGRWVAQVVVGHRANGNAIYRTRSAASRRIAEAKLRELEAEIASGRQNGLAANATMADLLTRYAQHKAATLQSIGSVRGIEGNIRNHLIPHLGHIRVQDLRPMHVERMMVAIARDEHHPAAALKCRDLLRAAWNWGHRQRWIGRENAAEDADPKLAHYRTKPHHSLTTEQMRVVIDAPHPLRSLWIVMIASGMRISEILAVTWEDVDLDNAIIGVPGTKTPLSEAPILLPNFAVDVLHKHKLETNGFRGLVWRTRTGGRYDRSNVYRYWLAHLAELGLPHITLHEAARHTYARIARERGVPVSAVQAVLRHTQMSTTSDIYGAGRSLREQRLAVDALERLFS